MAKLFIVPILLALILYLVYSFYSFSSPEEKADYRKKSFGAIVFLSLAIFLLSIFVILF